MTFAKLKAFLFPAPVEVVGITRGLRKELEALPPGQSLHITSRGDGAEFVIMNADDFDHILSLAKLRGVRVKEQG